MRRVLILGSTGSIGTQALDVIRDRRDRIEIVGLSAGANAELLGAQAAELGVPAQATALVLHRRGPGAAPCPAPATR